MNPKAEQAILEFDNGIDAVLAHYSRNSYHFKAADFNCAA